MTGSSKLVVEPSSPNPTWKQKKLSRRPSPLIVSKTQPLHSNYNKAPPLASLLAGVGSGALSSLACAPLDLIRTRLQVLGSVQVSSRAVEGRGTNVKPLSTSSHPSASVIGTLRSIVKEEGWRGCFRGLGATLITVPTFWGIYFPLYEASKNYLHSRNDARDGNIYNRFNDSNKNNTEVIAQHLISAVVAGAAADVFCNPLFVVRTRMQTEMLYNNHNKKAKPDGIAQVVKSLYREGGFLIFWRGLSASLLGLSHVAIQFPVYEQMKAVARRRSENGIESPLDILLASGISKICATTLTYPHEVMRSRMMDHRSVNSSKGMGIVTTFRQILRKEGPLAFYSGLRIGLIRVLPNCCITFASYELIIRWIKEISIETESN